MQFKVIVHFLNKQAACRRQAIVLFKPLSSHGLSGYHTCSTILRLAGKLKAIELLLLPALQPLLLSKEDGRASTVLYQENRSDFLDLDYLGCVYRC